MRTSKPIATISYNTQEYLVSKLEELIRNHKISDYVFINHFAEVDEKKNHIHLWLKPNTLLDTMELQEYFKELDLQHSTKPLGCIDFRLSKIDDFILYTQHYAPYLASKGEAREFHYTKDDFVYHDEFTFDELYNHALKGSEWAVKNQMLQALSEGLTSPAELVASGAIPFNMTSQLSSYMSLIQKFGLERNKRKGHD